MKHLIVGGSYRVSLVSRKDVYIHLFNDLLLLSVQRYGLLDLILLTLFSEFTIYTYFRCIILFFHTLLSGHRFVVQDHAKFPDNVHVEELKTTTLGLAPESFLLRLTRTHSRSCTAPDTGCTHKVTCLSWLMAIPYIV